MRKMLSAALVAVGSVTVTPTDPHHAAQGRG